jgi:large subunit ribosomal protein L22e
MEKKEEIKENKTSKKEKVYKKYFVDFSDPLDNKLLSIESAMKYLNSNMKIDGLKGNLKDFVKINVDDKRNKKSLLIQVDNQMQFSKKYIKYLVKKFLKREGIVKYLTVLANSPNSYEVKVLKNNNSEGN